MGDRTEELKKLPYKELLEELDKMCEHEILDIELDERSAIEIKRALQKIMMILLPINNRQGLPRARGRSIMRFPEYHAKLVMNWGFAWNLLPEDWKLSELVDEIAAMEQGTAGQSTAGIDAGTASCATASCATESCATENGSRQDDVATGEDDQ
ncbi:MAG TPA: hypothetical protein PL124_09095 [Candidatus Cloacimonadota bacterium]|nr:hypothetical protein [Candidatus Cloacimonadota bacterium]